MKTILVTGGAGYIGSQTVGLLLENGFNVIVVDNLTFGGESLLHLFNHPRFSLIREDVSENEKMRAIFRNGRLDAVVHLAAIVGDPACQSQPKRSKSVNLDASLNLLDLSMKHNVKRFIFASTCSNYGKMPDPHSFVDENSPLAPVSLYAKLKVTFERVLLDELREREGFSPTSLRFATAYGMSSRMRFDLTVNEFTKELALGRELKVFGEQFWRPYCHVHDIARAILMVLKSPLSKVAYNVFNVGDTKENYQKQMIVGEIKKHISKIRVRYVSRKEDPRDYRVSFEKIKRELGFTISKRVPDGIKEVKYLIEQNIIPNPDDPKYKNTH